MRISKTIACGLACLVSAFLAACGGGGGSGNSGTGGSGTPGGGGTIGTTPPATQSPVNFIRLQSDSGDYLGQGLSYDYTQLNSVISVSASGGHFSVFVDGDTRWNGDFQVMNTLSQIQTGTYANLQRYPFHDPAAGGLTWYGDGRGCNTSLGSFTVDNVNYVNGALTLIDLRFDLRCGTTGPALHGQIHWISTDPTVPPGPAVPPANLWQPTPGTTPATGNYIYLESEAGDPIGQGRTYTHTQANAIVTVSSFSGHLSAGVDGDYRWSGDFVTMTIGNPIKPGYYANLLRYPFNNPATGGLEWSGNGRGCNKLNGWYVVDNINYVNGVLNAVDLRFEQHCDGISAALHGKIHWAANDPTTPPGPVNPPPAGLWQPTPGSTPATGNYIYLQSDSGDFIGQGQTYTYTQANSILTLTANRGNLSTTVIGDKQWSGDFRGMINLTTVQPGFYDNLRLYGSNNPAIGGISWSGDGRRCASALGWYAVDNVVYTNGVLTTIDLRFEQHCENNPAAQHGKIHWTSADSSMPPGPINPPPAGLWQPAAGATPTNGNYVYLQSDAGDYMGQGQAYIYTQANSAINLVTNGGYLSASVNGNLQWSGSFKAMSNLTQLQPGYYANLQRFPLHNPAIGGLYWSASTRSCNSVQGWFAIDGVTFLNGTLTSIDLRFEQHCEGTAPALHGKIHWSANDMTTPAGPVNPPPAGLWQPAPGATPSSGNFIYLESEPGEYVGLGQTYSYTQANAILAVSANGNRLAASVNGNNKWSGIFVGMNSIAQLQAGYYGNLLGYPLYNPAIGGLIWSSDQRSCLSQVGWFVIDNVSFVNGALTAVDMRFEQRCGASNPALHGQIHWTSNDPTAPPAPVNPPPAGLWKPSPGATPGSGNYVYLQSDAGDYIGQGQTNLYTPANATISLLGNSPGYVSVNINGSKLWSGDFKTMDSLSQIQPGYYPNLQRYPFYNPVFGGLNWTGDGRGCNLLQGWIAVDGVSYVNGVVTSIDLRFEQHCEGAAPALHGQIHWVGP